MKKKTVLAVMILCFGLFLPGMVVFAGKSEKEPNDTLKTAQKVIFGEQYNGTVKDDGSDDIDYYRIPVKEGKFYKITLSNHSH